MLLEVTISLGYQSIFKYISVKITVPNDNYEVVWLGVGREGNGESSDVT